MWHWQAAKVPYAVIIIVRWYGTLEMRVFNACSSADSLGFASISKWNFKIFRSIDLFDFMHKLSLPIVTFV